MRSEYAVLIPAHPIVVNEHGDVTIFATVRHAEQYLEPIDVENNEYVGYDALARKLRFSTTGRHVTITLAGDPTSYPSELEDLLRTFLGALRQPAATNLVLTLAELLRQCEPYAQT